MESKDLRIMIATLGNIIKRHKEASLHIQDAELLRDCDFDTDAY
jgi:hypothetical protein